MIPRTAIGERSEPHSVFEPQALRAHRMSAALVTGTWLFLIAATLAGWLLAHIVDMSVNRIGIAAIVALAAIKIYLVLDVFMGLRHAPNGWRVLIAAWLLSTCGVILMFVLPR